MGIFKFFSSRIPSKPRNKDLQTTGSVSVNVQKNVGMRTENASTVVQNVIAPENRKGKITITDLLQIPVAEIGAADTYLVYSSGSDEAGWHTGGQFEYDGELYDDGTFFLWSIDRWVAVYKDNQTEEKQPTIFNPLQKMVSLITKTFAQSSYYNLPGRYKAGIPIAEIRKYELDEARVYQEKTESQSGTYAAETSVMTLVVPYAHSYVQGGETVYEGGALTAADYEKLCKGGNGNVDDVQVNGASVVQNNIANIALSTYLNSYATQLWVEGKGYLTSASLNGYATQNWVNQQGFLKSVPSSYATQSWVQSQGYAPNRMHRWFATNTRVTAKLFSFSIPKGAYGTGSGVMSYASRVGGVGTFRYFFSDTGGSTLGVWTYYTINAQADNAYAPALYVTSDANYWTITCYAVIEVYSNLAMQELSVFTPATLVWNTDLYPANVTAEGAKADQTFSPIPIDTSAPEIPSDDHAPSTKFFIETFSAVGVFINAINREKAKFAIREYVYLEVTNNGSSYSFRVSDKSFSTASVLTGSNLNTIKLDLGFAEMAAARIFLRDYRVTVTQTNSFLQFPDSSSVVTVVADGGKAYLEITITQGSVEPDPTSWIGIQFQKLNNFIR